LLIFYYLFYYTFILLFISLLFCHLFYLCVILLYCFFNLFTAFSEFLGSLFCRERQCNLAKTYRKSQTAFELWKPKENSGRQQLSGAPHATHAKSVDKHVRRELDCTPTLARINTDYDPGSVVSTAQSNNIESAIIQICCLALKRHR